MTANLPQRLHNLPLVDAIFEVRFATAVPAMPASSILPGVFFSKIQGEKKIERLPISDLPVQFRQADPQIKFQPLARLHIDGFSIAISDESVSVASKLPYRGWELFKKQILDTLEIVASSGVVGKVNRYSMRYINILEEMDQVSKRINLEIKIGNRQLGSEPFQLRVEIPRDDLQQVITMGSPATVNFREGGGSRRGILVDIDVSCSLLPVNLDEHGLSVKLDAIHDACKETFFDCLTDEVIQILGPQYD
jgi:uncharacterized protein (TIGR04255 family)